MVAMKGGDGTPLEHGEIETALVKNMAAILPHQGKLEIAGGLLLATDKLAGKKQQTHQNCTLSE